MRLTRIPAVLVFGLSLCALALAQSSPSQFDVASVKRNVNGIDSEFEVTPGGRLHATNRTPSDLIFHAYDLRPYQIPDDPAWIRSDHYDIEAKTDRSDRDLSWTETMQLLQRLLEDRFKLKAHWDTRERPVFFLRRHQEASS
jgi:uncharacterized protein (TIGR03435 family)